MRHLSILLALSLLAALGTAALAQASPLPLPAQPAGLLLEGEEEAEESGAEEEEAESEEAEETCEPDPELEISCEEETPAQSDRCLLKKASAKVTANPGKQRLRLSVRYRTLEPATVAVEASLRGPKGFLQLGTDHARFRRSGVYRDTFALPAKRMKKALAARDFEVELQVVGTPSSCRVELNAHRDGVRKLVWS